MVTGEDMIMKDGEEGQVRPVRTISSRLLLLDSTFEFSAGPTLWLRRDDELAKAAARFCSSLLHPPFVAIGNILLSLSYYFSTRSVGYTTLFTIAFLVPSVFAVKSGIGAKAQLPSTRAANGSTSLP